MKRFCLALALCLLMPISASAGAMPSLDMAKLTQMLEKAQHKVVMINFFATWCPPCKTEIPEIIKLRDAFPQDKLQIIGLSVDEDESAVTPFVSKLGVNYPVFMASKAITDTYKVSSVPHNAFIAPDGRLVISEPGMAEFPVLKQVVADLLKVK